MLSISKSKYYYKKWASLLRRPFLKGIKMRLDKYLKVSRIIKRRTVANEACDAGKVEVNGKIARASYDVKVGDVIKVSLGQNQRSYKVLEINEHALKEDALKVYEII